ncbi:TIGR04063 family PEP-CTERM/XrtA system glycosyltransferase [Allopontixanthobacter sediminis]|uniref:Glycosyltransferase, exosortase A system-associated n=1 Tax=Allopontixanthobacter sediminis TaxID=1689985 RepID=A0A845B168_9SPHN|nr:TIGR04063 family PEP-CTERM/XrtA system glycosyltransferase [Allopontixanthobacter sediminis]MXP44295.1 glycosyltransferase, exosortase A system-associated [Allopontixanthobacter sediminis]
MTRVLHVLDHSLPMHSGYTFRTRAIMRSQQAAGIDVRGITGLRHEPGEAAAEVHDGLMFHRTPGAASGPAGMREWREVARFADAIGKLADGWRPDILHAHSPALCGLAAMKVARARGIPLVYEIRAFWEDAAVGNRTGREGSIRYRATRALENRVVAGADAVFTICEGLRDDLIGRGFPGGKIGLSPNGVDLTLFGDPPPRDDRLASELGITAGAPVIGFIGSFYDYEGLDDLIAAMPLLRARHPGAQLLLVGGGPMDGALREQAAASSASDAIIFTGRVPHDQVERYYSLVDILAYPRKRSRLTDLVTPLKPLEAMAQRRIVAASDVGGHRELIKDGVTGSLFPADDPQGCADALADLIDARADWDAMRGRGVDHVRRYHDWALNIPRYQSVYHHLLRHVPRHELQGAVPDAA